MSLYILKLYQFFIEIANTSLKLFQMLSSCDRNINERCEESLSPA